MSDKKEFIMLTDNGVNYIAIDALVEWFKQNRDKSVENSPVWNTMNWGYIEWKKLAEKVYKSGIGLRIN